ncbi:hypothetical protein, partial [Brevundimonas sp. RM1]
MMAIDITRHCASTPTTTTSADQFQKTGLTKARSVIPVPPLDQAYRPFGPQEFFRNSSIDVRIASV